MIIFLLEWRSYFMERENFNFEESSSNIDTLVRRLNIASVILPIAIILFKIATLYFVKDIEDIGDIIELGCTFAFMIVIIRYFYKLYNYHDQQKKNGNEAIEIPEQLKRTYKPSVVKDAEENFDYIGSVKLLLDHGFKEFTGQLFATIIAVVGLWIPDSLSENGSKLILISLYFATTLIIFAIVSYLLEKEISRPFKASDFARVGFCIFTSGLATIGLFFFQLVFLFNDEGWWIVFIGFYSIFMVGIYITSHLAKSHINKVEMLKCQVNDANNSLNQ